MTNVKAYAVEGLHYCEMCFPQIFDPGKGREYELMTASDFPNEPVSCEQCQAEDVFGRETYIVLDLSDESWLIPWPTEPGHYWFHGWRYGDDSKEKPQTFLVRAYIGTGDKLSYLAYGRFVGYHLYKSRACGVWHPRRIVLPIPPQTPKGEAK